MTAPDDLTGDPWLTFISLLHPRARASLNRTQAAVAAVHAATNHGWTPQLLAAECSRDLADVHNPGAVITDRLRKATQHPPVGTDHARRLPLARLPFCSLDCEDRAGWLENENGQITGRCPCRTRPTGGPA